MISLDSAIKRECSGSMSDTIRAILYDRRLTYGAKVLALVVLDSPISSTPKTAVLARKIGSSQSQVSSWRQELIRNGYRPRPEKNQA